LWEQYKDGSMADYTQYFPRGHYTRDSGLRAYFRTMMYLGRNGYLLGKDVGIKDANLLMSLFAAKGNDGVVPLVSWQKITDITDFYAGKTDDVTYSEWHTFLGNILEDATGTSGDLVGDAAIGRIKDNIDQLRKPRILSDVVIDPGIRSKTKADLLSASSGFRIFGQKFTFDAWILNDLTAGQEASPVKLPSTPTALFVPAALGDARARTYVSEFLSNEKRFSPAEVSGFLSRLDNKTSDLRKIKPEEWAGSLGTAWLDLLSTLTHPYNDAAYPAYMRSPVFPGFLYRTQTRHIVIRETELCGTGRSRGRRGVTPSARRERVHRTQSRFLEETGCSDQPDRTVFPYEQRISKPHRIIEASGVQANRYLLRGVGTKRAEGTGDHRRRI